MYVPKILQYPISAWFSWRIEGLTSVKHGRKCSPLIRVNLILVENPL